MIIANYFNGWLESMWPIRSASLHCRNVTEVNQVLQNGHICLCKWPSRGLCPKAMLCCWFPEVGREGSLDALFSSIGHTFSDNWWMNLWRIGGTSFLDNPTVPLQSSAQHDCLLYIYIHVCVCVCVCVEWHGVEIEPMTLALLYGLSYKKACIYIFYVYISNFFLHAYNSVI